jgi:hypothetical protein
MESRTNPFFKKTNTTPTKSTNNRWNEIKEEVARIEYDNNLERETENKFKNFNNRRTDYSKFMRFTHKKEVKEVKKVFDLETMKDDFPELGKK